ncbi:hypothetical protein GP486_003742 [Trichoglossum hirsutum]|uniref:YDG domain-containing protein n=1 Tax=Trichoglossum hirsutum TaxID=265104 RepID=A0A9P8LCH5_9PEZI|nr:hypothetical protein GP486_003742 [Trichoglossum hirsutum]
MESMTEYELMRERNIANNRATLASLGLEFGKHLLSGPGKPAPNAAKARKRKLAVVDAAAGSPRRSLRRRTGASTEENPEEEFEYHSLGDSDSDEEDDSAENRPKALRKNRVTDRSTIRRYREPVIKATGNYRVICVRHPDGTYEEDGRDTGMITTPPQTDQSVSQAGASEGSTPTSVPKTSGLNKDQKDLAASKIFGHQPKVPIGKWYPGRRGFHDALVHRGLVNGIFGDEEEGAYSVSVSGGYEDDVDEGYKFVFTGEGGRHLNVDPKTGKAKNLRTAPQTRAQGMKKGNLALKKSCETGNPVRVIRGHKGKSVWAPREGYRYDGLYQVLKVWEDTGLSGYPVFRFAFVRLPDQPPIKTSGKSEDFPSKPRRCLYRLVAGPGSWTEEEVEELQAKEEAKRLLKNLKRAPKARVTSEDMEVKDEGEPKDEAINRSEEREAAQDSSSSSEDVKQEAE